ncbi:glycoside hydrolase family 71/99-like protein [Limibacter armeniacum]|uniref:glycoside hydrolase family 71/99-like protein n=1 Tax=Limibacter armeniacum TaxID=466084 RepID=UPI002FE64CEA
MKRLLLGCVCFLFLFSCNEDDPSDSGFKLEEHEPVAVSKTADQKVYVHLMPWFESKETSGSGSWGIHWTMANQNPDQLDGDRRQIASHYYPLTGPYASGDRDIIEYQLLLMKLSGIDGVLIDWPGTTDLYDYAANLANSNAIIDKLEKVGLEYAIVYEDQNINIAYDQGVVTNKIQAAQADVSYMAQNYFKDSNYIKVNGKPLLMVFGPQTFTTEASWSQILSVASTSFITLWHESGEAGSNATGEYAWVYSDHMNGLKNFYENNYGGLKIGSVYPGFKTFYNEGGWGGPTFSIDHNQLSTFTQTLDLALDADLQYIQLVTWNDYGEGTMIEPTEEFGYGFLTTLQQKLGVGFGEEELKLVRQLYDLRQQSTGKEMTQQLDQVFYKLVSLRIDEAKGVIDELTQ